MHTDTHPEKKILETQKDNFLKLILNLPTEL